MKYQELEIKYNFKARISGGVGEGWVPILDRLFGDLTSLGWDQEKMPVAQIKEKFGELRVYLDEQKIDHESERAFLKSVEDRLGQAATESYTVCQHCGEPGKLRGGRWLRVLCDDCDRKYLAGERWR